MDFTITAKTEPDCIKYLFIEDDGAKLTLEQFVSKYKADTTIPLDARIESHAIYYREKSFSHGEMVKTHVDFANSLHFFERYNKEVYPQEHFLMIGNYDYYKSAKFLKKAEKCLQTARYYLICSETILDFDCNLHWEHGYGAQFFTRSLNFTTATVWYNNCFDYILQIVYLAFGLYKQVRGYQDTWSIEETLKKCSYRTIKDIYSANNTVANFTSLWTIIEDCHTALTDVNEWANYIKHKGGIDIAGLEADAPFSATMTDVDGNVVAQSDEFSPIKVDLDVGIVELSKAHDSLFDCLDKLVTFIDYNAAIPQADVSSGKMLIPDRNNYVKVILP